jgi:hypothetical protein
VTAARRQGLRCEEVADELMAVAAGDPIIDLRAQAHVRGCPRCQDELIQYRTLLRSLRRLRTDVLEPAPGLLAEVLAAIGAAGERHAVDSLVTGRRLAYAGGIAAAGAGVAVGVALLAGRSRRHRRGAPVRSAKLAAILPSNRA